MSLPALPVPNTDPRERRTLANLLTLLELDLADVKIALAGLDARVPADARAARTYANVIAAAHQRAIELANAALNLGSHLATRIAEINANHKEEPPMA